MWAATVKKKSWCYTGRVIPVDIPYGIRGHLFGLKITRCYCSDSEVSLFFCWERGKGVKEQLVLNLSFYHMIVHCFGLLLRILLYYLLSCLDLCQA